MTRGSGESSNYSDFLKLHHNMGVSEKTHAVTLTNALIVIYSKIIDAL